MLNFVVTSFLDNVVRCWFL